MQAEQILFSRPLEMSRFNHLIENALRYAVISIPFTVNRMNICDIEQRIVNIAKGKIAEYLFFEYCRQKDVSIKTDECSTAFWMPDKRDFVLNGIEWDIKNNYLFHSAEYLPPEQYLDLYALVPDRFHGDQWSKRHRVKLGTAATAFVFTFMKNLDSYTSGQNFLNLVLTDEQESFIHGYYQTYCGRKFDYPPFLEEDFWASFSAECRNTPFMYTVHHQPGIVITAWASVSHWKLFEKISPGRIADGLMATRIVNRGCPLSDLPAFSQIIGF